MEPYDPKDKKVCGEEDYRTGTQNQEEPRQSKTVCEDERLLFHHAFGSESRMERGRPEVLGRERMDGEEAAVAVRGLSLIFYIGCNW